MILGYSLTTGKLHVWEGNKNMTGEDHSRDHHADRAEKTTPNEIGAFVKAELVEAMRKQE